ncbi:MAG: hemolysin family protein [Bacteroidota bacterium]
MILTISIIFFLVLSALFSGSEIAYVSANRLKIELIKKRDTRRGRIINNFYERPANFLGTMLVGNNAALVIFTMLMESVLNPFYGQFIKGEIGLLLIITLTVTIVVLIFGEFIPKTLFRLFSDDILYFLAFPLRFFQWFLAPLAWIMTKGSNFLLKRVFKFPIEQTEQVFTRVDLEEFISQSQSNGEEEEIDTELFGKALNLKDVKVREAMVPRPEIEDIDVNDDLEALEELIRSTKLSRIIVSEGDIDNVLGYIHHQQLLKKPESIRSIVMDIPFVPEVMRVTDLMNKFIRERIYIACVVDEFGGVSGIITLEDILEELFGEIEDEHDQEEHIENQISETEFLFSGRLEIGHLNEKYEAINFPEGEYHTLSGYLVMTTETIPEKNSELEMHGYRFILEMVSDKKIEMVRVIKLDEQDGETST